MDILTERFSVYDFFNPIIAGMTFILAEGICSYSFFTQQLLELFKGKKTVDVQVLMIISVLIAAYIIGAFLQGPVEWLIDKGKHYERDLVEECLGNTEELFSQTRRQFIINKAKDYLKVSDEEQWTEDKRKDYGKTFYAHCIYYLHINKLDGKTERMRETQALSKLLVGVFFLVPVISFIIAIIEYKTDNMNYNWLLTVSEWAICLVLSIGFYFRYKMATKNRIIMTLSLYDASIDNATSNDIH